MIFLSSTKRNATSSDIETHNTFVQKAAAAGHAKIQNHRSRYLEPIKDDATVASNDDGGRGLNSKLICTPTSTGDFLIQVSSTVDERGTYKAKVTGE